MKQNKEDFKKAVKKKILGNLVGTLGCGFLVFMFISIFYCFYSIEPEVGSLFLILGIFSFACLLYNLIEIIFICLYSEDRIIEDYNLCKRCKSLVNKNKVFCNDCKYDIKRSLKYEGDKKYFNEYTKIVKQEMKK